MLTQAPPTASRYTPPSANRHPDDLSGHRHRQAIGYLGLALPLLLVQPAAPAATDFVVGILKG